MKRSILVFFIANISLGTVLYSQNNVGIGTPNPNPSSALEIMDSTRGLLIPRLTSAQRNSINAPANGLLVYDIDVNCLYYYVSASGWSSLCQTGASMLLDSVFFNCGIGTISYKTAAGTFSSADMAWLGSGINTGVSGGAGVVGPYLGTSNNDDVRIATNNGNCMFNPKNQKMIVTAGGNVGIGSYDGTNLPLYPQSKVLINNGTINNSIFQGITNVTAPDVALVVSSSTLDPGATVNMGVLSVAASTSTKTYDVNIGIYAGATTAASNLNTGLYGTASGAPLNIGLNGNASSTLPGTQNRALLGTTQGNNSTSNIGVQTNVEGNSNNNWTVASPATGSFNAGGLSEVSGQTSMNIGFWGSIVDIGKQDSGSTCVGLFGSSVAQVANGQVGVVGEVVNVAGAAYNYGVQGIQPGTNSGPGSTLNGNPTPINYAGYFEGDVFAAGTYFYSDPKLKRDVSDYTSALDKLAQLPVKEYDFKTDEYPDLKMPAGRQIGIMAPDLQSVFPAMVKWAMHNDLTGKKNDVRFEAVNYVALVPVLVQAVNELNHKVRANTELQSRLSNDEKAIDALMKEVEDLKLQLKAGSK